MPSHPGPAPNQPPREYSLLAGLLSYLIPGLGQVYQGRVGKGLLFFVCIYALFFYGMALGQWKNVYLADTAEVNNPLFSLGRLPANLYNRPQFLGQFWVGVAAWPAVLQYSSKDGVRWLGDFQRTPPEDTLNELQIRGDKTWDLAWVYTVIAGVLNVLVIYDAVAGPAFQPDNEPRRPTQEAAPA